MHYFGLYLTFIKVRLKAMIEYRGSFLLGGISQACSYGAEFLLIWIMINQFKTIGGWGPYEVMFLFALNLCSYCIAGFFMFNIFANLATMIRSGDFDEVLTKPLNPFLYLVCRKFNQGYFSHLTLSTSIIILCLVRMKIHMSFLNILWLLVVLFSGALIQGSAFIFTSVPSFWLIQGNRIMSIFFWDLKSFIKYPLSAYNRTIQIVLTLIFPYAFINFYPAQYFLKKNDFLMFNPVFQFLSPVIGIVLFSLAYRFWLSGINHYKSTGS